jgi:hypothetical protein
MAVGAGHDLKGAEGAVWLTRCRAQPARFGGHGKKPDVR